ESSAVIRDDAVTCAQKSWHLLLPRSATEWISVDEDHGFTRPVILIIEVDVPGVFCTNINVRHSSSPFLFCAPLLIPVLRSICPIKRTSARQCSGKTVELHVLFVLQSHRRCLNI